MVEQSFPVREYTVVATNLLLRHWWNLPRFLSLTNRVGRQLKDTPGLVTYRLKANFLKLRFSTLSVWEDENAIRDFVLKGPHLTAMQTFPKLSREGSAFVRWTTTSPDGVTWEEAFHRLHSPDHSYQEGISQKD
jgi:hypothetical protein